jgi:hypothetical protein
MQSLRSRYWLARLILAWFAVTLGVAVASPVVHPQAFELVCTASGDIKMVALDEDAAMGPGHHQLDCPLCLTAGAPPATLPHLRPVHDSPLARALRPAVAAHIASLTRAPLPARGPPATDLPSS